MSKKSLQAKIVKHSHRKRFQEYLRTKGRDKATIGYVYWSMFLRSGQGNRFELEESLFLGDLGITHPTLWSARNQLQNDGWLSCDPQKIDPLTGKHGTKVWTVHTEAVVKSVGDGTDVNSVDVNSVDVNSTDVRSVDDTVVLHSLDGDESPSTSSVTPSANTSSEGWLACQSDSASALPRLSPSEKQQQQTSSSLPANQDQKQNQNQNQTDLYTEQIANDIGCDGTIPALLGFPYFHDGHDPELQVMAEVLIQRNRSLHWLVDLVVWMKEHKFWSKRIHTGDRGVKQLAKHLSNGELVEQFESHLVLKHRCGMTELPAYLLRTREQILAAFAASKAA